MAWEDRTPAEQAQADQDAAAYRDNDDDVTYIVTTERDTPDSGARPQLRTSGSR